MSVPGSHPPNTQTIEIPRFWTFVLPCGCLYGSLLADQGDIIIATPTQAWAGFYEFRKADGHRDRKAGRYVRAHQDGDWDKFGKAHDADCTEAKS